MLFILERLEPLTIDELEQAGRQLCWLLKQISPTANLVSRSIKQ